VDPDAIPKPVWTTATFLHYVGVLFVGVAVGGSLAYLPGAAGWGPAAGWALLEFVVLVETAILFGRRGRWIAAGLFSFVATITWGALCGLAMVWLGGMSEHVEPLTGTHPGLLLVEALALAGAIAAFVATRFPLLMLLVTAAGWLFVNDLVSNGGGWSAVVTLLYGFVLLGVAALRGRSPETLWLHVASALSIGGAVVWFCHSTSRDVAVLTVVAAVFVAFGILVRRSSWAVVGAYGLYVVVAYWGALWARPRGVDARTSASLAAFSLPLPAPLTFLAFGSAFARAWAYPVVYALLGLALTALALFAGAREQRASPGAAIPAAP